MLEWTWGEAVAYINAHVEREKEAYRMRALMDVTQIGLLARALSGSGGNISVMGEYSYLWTKEERMRAKVARLRADMEAKAQATEAKEAKGGPAHGD